LPFGCLQRRHALFERDRLDDAPLRFEDGGYVLGDSGGHLAFGNRAQERGMCRLLACRRAHVVRELDRDRRASGIGRLCR